MNREQIEARLEMLKKERAMLQQNLIQMQANLNAYDGAITDCEYWLNQIDQAAAESAKE